MSTPSSFDAWLRQVLGGRPLPPRVTLAGRDFYGPVSLDLAEEAFRGWSGVYVVASPGLPVTRYLDVGESSNVGQRLAGHERRDCWARNATGPVSVFATEVKAPFNQYQVRLRVEADVRARLVPFCGTR